MVTEGKVAVIDKAVEESWLPNKKVGLLTILINFFVKHVKGSVIE
jgi:hypothetical protein